MALRELIDDFSQKLTSTSLKINVYSHTDLQDNLLEILNTINVDYDIYSTSISKLLRTLERNKDLARTLLINNYLSLYHLVLGREFTNFNEDVLTADFEKDIAIKWGEHLEKSMYNGIQVRVSDFHYNTDGLKEIEKFQIISMTRGIIQKLSENITWNNEIVNDALLQLATARSILDEVGESEHFYFLAGNIVDRYHTSQLQQNARDLAEELILTSFRQGLPHWGFYMYYKSYSNSSSAISALLYGNLSLTSALVYKNRLNIHYAKEVIWESVKFFRNIGIVSLVERIFKSIPKKNSLDGYSRRSITHSYYTALMTIKDPELPSLILDFLNENREQMLSNGEVELAPWLLTLFNIEVLYFNTDFQSHPLYQYVKIFESIVQTNYYSSRKSIIYQDLPALKLAMKEALIRLRDTRYALDFVNDNSHALLIASKIVEPASNANDVEALLLAMTVKTDYTYVFIEQSRQELAEVKIAEIDYDSFGGLYWDFNQAVKELSSIDKAFVWIINSDNKYYILNLHKGKCMSNQLDDWQHSQLTSLFSSKYFSHFKFDKTENRQGQIVQLFPEDYLRESNEIKSRFDFMRFDDLGAKTLDVVLDMNVSEFPHNLFLDLNGDFIYPTKPITNIISTEWYLRNSNKVKLTREFSKSIWIPTEGGDFAITMLFQNLEELLLAENFQVKQNLIIDAPISSEINILVSHGMNDIAINQAIYPDDNPVMNISPILGAGKILDTISKTV